MKFRNFIMLLTIVIFVFSATGCAINYNDNDDDVADEDGLASVDSNRIDGVKTASYGDDIDGAWSGTIDEDRDYFVEIEDGIIRGKITKPGTGDAFSGETGEEILGTYYLADDNTIVTDLNVVQQDTITSSDVEVYLNQPAKEIDDLNVIFKSTNNFDESGVYDSAGEKSDMVQNISVDAAINSGDNDNTGFMILDNLWIRSVINTEDKGSIEGKWKLGGMDITARGDKVVWGYFYADPNIVNWGNQNNPDLFVKIWFNYDGQLFVDYFHVSVPSIDVYTDYPYDGNPDEQGKATLDRRFVEHRYNLNGNSSQIDQYEDGSSTPGYYPSGNPDGIIAANDLRIGAVINTVDSPIEAEWNLGGKDVTARGDEVVWGYFYANPSKVSWGSPENPDLFVKIWFDVGGAVFVDFFHVSVPDIDVYSELPNDNFYDNKGTSIMSNRFIEHRYYR